ncbi:hypothetical protein IV203_029044 [Nitzschia inconspicua]|uniref:Uncharacterized protein n=1 Tax=Nitzschia inconspicua TaxID=303405 RepID=A0A9K3Q2X5_9STRA|nr:hypothetical protein IV203_029044 [Nitzschia inconspicua]
MATAADGTLTGFVWQTGVMRRDFEMYGDVLFVDCMDMAPGRKLYEIKFIVGDGIFAGESVLSKLGIQDTCRLILDHRHLSSEDMGSWPKAFGLTLFSVLREELHAMVKSIDEGQYNQALEAVRSKLRHPQYHKHAEYFETNIHNKRHLFANHIIKTYPGHLNVQGNALSSLLPCT